MRIVIASDSYKGTNSSREVGAHISRGILKVFPEAEITVVPVADGGEGTVEAVISATGGHIVKRTVKGPLGDPVEASFGISGNGIAVIEMAEASGLPLVPENKRNPGLTTTWGTGELISAALDEGCGEIIIGIGGSATNDGGTGMAGALGYRFLDKNGADIPPGGKALSGLASIDPSDADPRIFKTKILLASDVNNPLLGEFGASAVYGPQKGADPQMVRDLETGLENLADITARDLGTDYRNTPGSGAAGGLGFGLLSYLNAHMQSGIEIVLDAVELDSKLDGIDLVVTGEGKLDGQSIYGKVPVGVAARAKKFGIPVVAVVGDIGTGFEAVYKEGIDSVMSTVNRAMPLKDALDASSELLEEASERLFRIIRIGMKLR